MKKLTRKSLSELAKTLPVIEKDVQASYIGGGDGSRNNPYTMAEIETLIENGTFKGGYIKDSAGSVDYWIGVATVSASSSSNSNNSDSNSWLQDAIDCGLIPSYDYYNSLASNQYFESAGNGGYNGSYADGFTLPILGGTEDAANYTSIVGKAIEQNGGITRIGSDGKIRFETRTGRVFYGNQYVATTSLAELGHVIGKYAGTATLGVTVYNVGATYYNEGLEAALKEGAIAAGAAAGATVGLEIVTVIGTTICPGPGSAVGLLVGTVGALGAMELVSVHCQARMVPDMVAVEFCMS